MFVVNVLTNDESSSTSSNRLTILNNEHLLEDNNKRILLNSSKNDKLIFRKLNIYFLYNIFVFNLFFTGFLCNFIAYSNSNWILNENYIFGLFEYCHLKSNQLSRLKNSHVFYKDQITNKITFRSLNEMRCFYWNDFNKPSKFSRYVFIFKTKISLFNFIIFFIF